MKSRNQQVREGFLRTLQEFRKEGKEFIAFRLDDGAVAEMELKGFAKYQDAAEFVSSQFAPDEPANKIEFIDRVILDVIQGKIKNWKDIACFEPYFRKQQLNKQDHDDTTLLEKKGTGGNSIKSLRKR